MRIDVDVDTSSLLLKLQNGERQLAIATVEAINQTALRVQQAEFDNVRRKFIVRKPTFFFGSDKRVGGVAAKIRPFASVSQDRPYAEVQTGAEALSAGRQRALLPQFETGGERQPMTQGARSVAIPLLGRPARPSIRQGVPPAFSFAGMQLTAYYHGKRVVRRRAHRKTTPVGLIGEYGTVALPESMAADKALWPMAKDHVQWRGKNRTFLLTSGQKEPLGGVYQRIGPARSDIRLIWAFRQHVQLDARLGYVTVAIETTNAWFREELQKQTVAALSHAGFAL